MLNYPDSYYMKYALEQAQKAAQLDEVPIGAVIVDAKGLIIAREHNKVEANQSPHAHAEMLAIASAGDDRGNWRLDDCTLYVTIEPCALCMHALLLSRIGTIVFGARSPLYGFSLDKYAAFQLYKTRTSIREGVSEHEATQLLQSFFSRKRSNGCERKKVPGIS